MRERRRLQPLHPWLGGERRAAPGVSPAGVVVVVEGGACEGAPAAPAREVLTLAWLGPARAEREQGRGEPGRKPLDGWSRPASPLACPAPAGRPAAEGATGGRRLSACPRNGRLPAPVGSIAHGTRPRCRGGGGRRRGGEGEGRLGGRVSEREQPQPAGEAPSPLNGGAARPASVAAPTTAAPAAAPPSPPPSPPPVLLLLQSQPPPVRRRRQPRQGPEAAPASPET